LPIDGSEVVSRFEFDWSSFEQLIDSIEAIGSEFDDYLAGMREGRKDADDDARKKLKATKSEERLRHVSCE
jgi:hypothetical protein